MPVNILIVGGGICGLSCAIALRHAGHNVTIYERYGADADAGAGIVVSPNGTKVLKSWGLDPAALGSSTWKEGIQLDGSTLDIRQRIYVDLAAQGDASHMTTRSDLRILLRREAEKQVEGEGTIQIVYNANVVDYDHAQSMIKLDSGVLVAGDLVVACDGIKSKAARIILGTENVARSTGYSAFRLLIQDHRLKEAREKFKDNEVIQAKFEEGSGQAWFATDQTGRSFVWWSCGFDTIHALDVIIPDNDSYASSEEWFARCEQDVLLHEFRHWHPVFTEILSAADKPLLWKICNRDPVNILHNGKLCMLGDALHPMPPYRAQGGTMSIEDAGVLGVCLSNLHDASEIPKRLDLLQKLRVPRYATTQMLSTIRLGESDKTEKHKEVLEICRKWFDGQDQSHLDDLQSAGLWLRLYDAVEEAKKALGNI
ncbi:FAD/NAD(P)-binding domain-containing protein [Thozetella sp. PMI_491]|nr:FAD/NAD(P)-binding domain-containing protein [Thozetella sp. PMI_491]